MTAVRWLSYQPGEDHRMANERRLRIEYMPLTDIKRAPRNPKDHDRDTILASFRRHGLGDVAGIVDERTGRLVAGHGRVEVLTEMRDAGDPPPKGAIVEGEDWTVPLLYGTRWRNASEAEAFLIGHNRSTELGGWKRTELDTILTEHRDRLAGTGYTIDDLPGGRKGLGDPDDDDEPIVAPPVTPISELGDVWTLGGHTVVCASSTDPASWELLALPRDADMVWTDPPYGVNVVGGTKDKLTIQNDGPAEAAAVIAGALPLAAQHTRPGAVWIVAAPAGPSLMPFLVTLSELRVWRASLVWVKDRFVLGHNDYHYRHELLLAGETPDPELSARDYEMLLFGWSPDGPHQRTPDRRQNTVVECPAPKASKDHPTMKPVALIDRFLRNHTKPGGLVLDPFGGSGSTLLAAEQLERRAFLLELDPRFVDVIVRRWAHHTGQQPLRNGRPHPAPDPVR